MHHGSNGFSLTKSENFIIVSPISYAGKSRKSENARYIYAMAEDHALPSFLGKIKGGFQGFMYGMSNYLPVIACSALAILGKNIVAKAGVVGLGCIAVYKVLRNGLGVGKNNPMT